MLKAAKIIGVVAATLVAALIIGLALMKGTISMNAETTFTTPVDIPEGQEVATFATGCFWCMEATFQEAEGVFSAVSGYAGGQEVNPTYEDVYSERTGHRESVQVFYDPSLTSFEKLLDLFWRGTDPTDPGGQFVDRGLSYTTAVFYHNDAQRIATEKSINDLEASGRFEKPIVTAVLPFTTFYRAEEYHQDFYKKSPERYLQYSSYSGRKEYKEAVWAEILKESDKD